MNDRVEAKQKARKGYEVRLIKEGQGWNFEVYDKEYVKGLLFSRCIFNFFRENYDVFTHQYDAQIAAVDWVDGNNGYNSDEEEK